MCREYLILMCWLCNTHHHHTYILVSGSSNSTSINVWSLLLHLATIFTSGEVTQAKSNNFFKSSQQQLKYSYYSSLYLILANLLAASAQVQVVASMLNTEIFTEKTLYANHSCRVANCQVTF